MDEEVDVSYRTCFLCTYRTFAMTEEVLQLLARRSVGRGEGGRGEGGRGVCSGNGLAVVV